MIRSTILPLTVGAALVPTIAAQTPTAIQAGNIVVVQKGSAGGGWDAVGNVSPSFVIEHAPFTGAIVQTIAMPNSNTTYGNPAPTGANRNFSQKTRSSTTGYLTVSADGRYLILCGYDDDLNGGDPQDFSTPSIASTADRVIGRIDIITGEIDTSTAFPELSGSVMRSACSDDGSRYWAVGNFDANGTLRYADHGATTSTSPSGINENLRCIDMNDLGDAVGQTLMITSQSGSSGKLYGASPAGLSVLGPTTYSILTGIDASVSLGAADPYDFWVANPSTVYLAVNDPNNSDGGVQKWTFNGTSWDFQYSLSGPGLTNTRMGARGVTGIVRNGTPEIWFTGEETTFVTHLAFVADMGAGSNSAIILATEPSGTDYAGVRIVPTQAIRNDLNLDGTPSGNVTGGCGASELQVTGPGLTGSEMNYRVTNTAGFPAINFGFTSFPGGIPFTPVSANPCDCTFLYGLDALIFGATATVPIPDSPAFIGAVIYAQGMDIFTPNQLCIDPIFQFPMELTDGYQFEVR